MDLSVGQVDLRLVPHRQFVVGEVLAQLVNDLQAPAGVVLHVWNEVFVLGLQAFLGAVEGDIGAFEQG